MYNNRKILEAELLSWKVFHRAFVAISDISDYRGFNLVYRRNNRSIPTILA